MSEIIPDIQKKLCLKEEDIIKEAIISKGFVINEQFIKDNFIWVENEGDLFKHLYYHFGQSDEHRIISFKKEIYFEYKMENGNLINATRNYYL